MHKKNKNYYIAVDLGAESGRVIVGFVSSFKLYMEEVYRFPTKQLIKDDTLFWDIYFIFSQIKKGLRIAASRGYNEPLGIGIDSWGVDFGLLDQNDELIDLPVAYRDKRTDGIMEKFFSTVMSKEDIYNLSGIQFLKFNTIFQLYSVITTKPEVLKKAKSFLMIPDLLNFFLSGKKFNEYTNATTTSLLNAENKIFDTTLFRKSGIPQNITEKIIKPANLVGYLKAELLKDLNLKSAALYAVGSHDTASAIVALPAQGNNWAYLSSGTWSLLGIEKENADTSLDAMKHGFTNEGGVNNTIRFLKNIMGLWILQRFKRSLEKNGETFEYSELTGLAEQASSFHAFFDPDSELFFSPDDMQTAIIDYLKNTKQNIPRSTGVFLRVIFENLALKIAYYLKQLTRFKKDDINVLHIVGGGSKNELLNQFIANAANIKVIAGPSEGTAAGNIMTQAMASGEVKSLDEIRDIIRESFPIKEYVPMDREEWQNAYFNFLKICNLSEK